MRIGAAQIQGDLSATDDLVATDAIFAGGANIASLYESKNADLTAIAALAGTGILRRTGAASWALASVGSTGLNVLGASTQSDGRAALGLGTAATLNFDSSQFRDRVYHSGTEGAIFATTYLGFTQNYGHAANGNGISYFINTDAKVIRAEWNSGGWFDWRVQGSWIRVNSDPSDERMKKNISVIDVNNLKADQSALSLFNRINPIEFDWDETKQYGNFSGHVKVGLSAQELYGIEPSLVLGKPYDPEDRPMSLNSSTIIPYLILAIKELSAQSGTEATNLQRFKRSFSAPGNALYASIWSKIKAAKRAATTVEQIDLADDISDHWDNFKNAVFGADQRGIILGVHRLQQLLATAGFAISQDDIAGWNQKCVEAKIDTLTWEDIPILLS